MAKIAKSDLEHLTSDQIKSFYLCDNIIEFNVSPIKEYIADDNVTNVFNRANRVATLLNQIVVERFVKGVL